MFGPTRDTTVSLVLPKSFQFLVLQRYYIVSGPTKEFPVFGHTRDTAVSLVLLKSFQSLVLPEILQCL